MTARRVRSRLAGPRAGRARRCSGLRAGPGFGAWGERSCTCSGPLVTQLDGWYHVPACGAGPNQTEDGEPLPCSYLGECVQCPSGMLCEGGVEILPELVFNAEVLGVRHIAGHDLDAI